MFVSIQQLIDEGGYLAMFILTSKRNTSSKTLHNLVNEYHACAKQTFFCLNARNRRFSVSRQIIPEAHFDKELCGSTIFD